MDFVSPGSQAKDGTFLGLEAALEGLRPGYLLSILDSFYYFLYIIVKRL
jgi:hypothetical protein